SDGDFHKNDLAKVQLDGKWGCIDVNGKEIVPLKYDEIIIDQLKNPHVAANLNGKWGFVDKHGIEIMPFEYDSVKSFSGCRACVEKNGKYGFIDDKGNVVIPLIYDDCESHFIENYENKHISPIWVRLDGKYGYIDINSKVIVAPMYEYATSFYYGNGMATVVINDKAGFIDETGKEVTPFTYEPDFDKPYNYRFYDNFANVKLNGKWGVIDRNNRVVIPFLYDEFLENRNAGWRYALRDGKKQGIDTKGNEWIMQKNPDACTFKDYLKTVTWTEVAKSFRTLIYKDKKLTDEMLAIYEENFNNFSTKTFQPSQNIIRIHAGYYNIQQEKRRYDRVDAALYCVKDERSYVFFDWAEILDMEVRIEDNLSLSDAEIVAICIWEACDQIPGTENRIENFLNDLHEHVKTIDENSDRCSEFVENEN
ncbi:MAG: WG repeat-containing protein, partial [Prevotellaceae bacterium]|nr:WG repeat-containing protein [Prevotellaceae bacterium]